jgi:hypothetical protein
MKQLIVVAVSSFALAAQDRSPLLAVRMLDPLSGRVMFNTIHVDQIESVSENCSAKATSRCPSFWTVLPFRDQCEHRLVNR